MIAAEPPPAPPSVPTQQAQARSVTEEPPRPSPQQQELPRLPSLALDPTPLTPIVPQQPPSQVSAAHAAQIPAPPSVAAVPAAEPPVVEHPPLRARHAAKPVVEHSARHAAAKETVKPTAAKKGARRNRAYKPATGEALNAVRKFGDTRPELSVNAYAADGTQRRVIIRPTSIQDLYYYSAPR